jgi:arylsulfatase A-like enzyme
MATGTRGRNLVWIMADQMRAQMLCCNGDPNAATPNLDILAATGVSLTGAVGGFPLCCPYRGSMLTSRYPHKCVPGHEHRLPPEMPTLADVFNDAGYDTAWIGKWHLDGFHESEGRAAMHIVPPERRGRFRHWVGYENNNSQWDCWVHGGEGRDAFHYRLPGYETDELTNLALRYLDERAGGDKPFFLVLSVQPPHDPYIAPPELMGKYNPARIAMRPNVPRGAAVEEIARRELAGAYAMVENLDANVGRVVAKLRETGLATDTHVIFFSDHGDMHGSHGMLRKTNPFEESIRVPFIMSGERPMAYDGRRTGRFGALVNHVDVAPTSLGLCGLPVPDWMEGFDYSHYRFRDARPANEPTSAYLQSVIPTIHPHSVDRPWRGVVTADGWKYACFERMPWLMFDLNDDPYELANLCHNSAYREQQRRLERELRGWVEKTGDDFAVPET